MEKWNGFREMNSKFVETRKKYEHERDISIAAGNLQETRDIKEFGRMTMTIENSGK